MAVSAQDLYRELQKLRKKPIEMNQKRKKKIVCQIEEEIFILYLLPSLFGNLFFFPLHRSSSLLQPWKIYLRPATHVHQSTEDFKSVRTFFLGCC